ncbi:MAG: ATP-binding protein [Sphingomonas sp.]|nr:MAG: ATP-binding protein [Sphingomonas sp.]
MLSRGLNGVTLVVADTGPDIPANQCEHGMTRFARLYTSRHSEGSGLGLSIARVAARVQGASLTLSDNAPGLRAAVHFSKA